MLGQIYALVLTISRNQGMRKRIEVEPDVIQQPKPRRIIAITPNYMENTSESDLKTILSQDIPITPKTEKDIRKVKNWEPPPPGIEVVASKGKRNRQY